MASMEFTVQVEKTSPIQRKLTIRVPAQTVASRFQTGLAEVARSARLKGFRPGMVPLSVVKQFYGDDVRHRVFHNLIDESYREALRKQNLRAVGSPQIDTPEHKTGEGEHDHSIREDQDLTYIATVEVLPEIEAKNYTGIPLTEGKREISDADVEGVIQNILNSQAQLVPLESPRAAQKGDFTDVTFSGGVVTEKGIEERPGMKGTRVIEIGSEALIPGFEENLIGMSAGETKTFRIPFPQDYFEADLAGKDAEFTVTINEIKEKKLPELSDEFVKQMGYESVAEMRKQAKEHLEKERAQEVDRKLRSDLLQALIERNEFEVPVALVQAQTRALAQDVGQNLKQQGFTDAMIQEALSAELDNLKKRAESQVRASLLLEAIAKKENISVDSKEIDEEMARMAAQMNMEVANIRDFYSKNPSRMEDLEFRMREDRTVRFLLDKAKVKKEK